MSILILRYRMSTEPNIHMTKNFREHVDSRQALLANMQRSFAEGHFAMVRDDLQTYRQRCMGFLSPNERKVLDFMIELIQRNHQPPTVEDIAHNTNGLGAHGITATLKNLHSYGYVEAVADEKNTRPKRYEITDPVLLIALSHRSPGTGIDPQVLSSAIDESVEYVNQLVFVTSLSRESTNKTAWQK